MSSTNELFLVSGEVEVSHYMSDRRDRSTQTRLVRAESAAQAEDKFRKHFEDRTSAYSTYYSVRDIEVAETLE